MLCRYRSAHLFLITVFVLPLVDELYAQGQPAARLTNSQAATVAERPGASQLRRLRSTLRSSPDDPITLNNLATLYVSLNRLDEALEMMLHSVSINNKLAATRMNLAGVYDRLGQHEKARSEAAAAARLDPNNLRIRAYLCELNMVVESDREAAECYQAMLDDFGPEPDFAFKLGLALFRSHRLQAAHDVLEKALAENPEDPAVLNILGNVHFRLKDYERSASLLRQAVELRPDDPQYRFNLAVAYLASKNRAGALSQYNLIKESDPELAGKLYRTLFQKYLIDARR